MSASEIAQPTLQGALHLLTTLDLGVQVVGRGVGEVAQCGVDDEVTGLRCSPVVRHGRVRGVGSWG